MRWAIGVVCALMLVPAAVAAQSGPAATAGAARVARAEPAQSGVTRYVRFERRGSVAYGVLEGNEIRELDGDLFQGRPTRRTHPVSGVRLLAPIDPDAVQKVFGVAINTRRPGRTEPVAHPRFFAKMPTSIIGPGDAIEHPPEAGNLDWEGELVLVIGRKARHVPVEEAASYIFGVSVGNDVSENTWYGERQGTGEPTRLISKASDTFAALGPVIATGLDYNDLDVTIRHNGQVVVQGNTGMMLNPPALLVSYLSRYFTLKPGDLIYTGTYPSLPGVDNTIHPRDVVEVEIEGIGLLRNPVTAMQSPLPPPPVAMAPAAAPAPDPDDPPDYQVDAAWPGSLPHNWILGQVSGVAVDGDGHIWIVHRPSTLTEREAGAAQDPPLGECCVPAPAVIEFDRQGNVLRAWGGKNDDYHWPDSEHGIFVDHQGSVWIGSNGRNDHVVLKFSPDGELLLQLGQAGQTGGSNDPRLLGQPADIAVDPETNEVYIADGYGNRRIIVFDAETGEYRRHWGAYGERPSDQEIGPYEPGAEPSRHFRSPVHAVRISRDGLVYVADRVNNRIQVFSRDGRFIREAFVAPETRSMGSVWDVEFSPDPDQTFVFVPDGTNNKVWILRRDEMEVVGAFGRGGRNAGQFGWVHNTAVDGRWNLFTSEVENYKRVQMFRPR